MTQTEKFRTFLVVALSLIIGLLMMVCLLLSEVRDVRQAPVQLELNCDVNCQVAPRD